MNFQKRKQIILETLKATGEVDIKRMAAELETSEITIRRDLNKLAEDGLLYRTHGGAMQVNLLEIPHDFVNKAARNTEAKDKICRAAAAEISDGDIVFMDCGSTVYRLCQFIKSKRIKVITNSLPVVYELQNSLVSLNIIGGEFNTERQAVHGKIANEHIARYKATKAFLGVDGISRNGLFANSELEASITEAFAAHSARTYLLCDESKIGRETYLKFAGLDAIDTVITNSNSEELEYFKKIGVEVIGV
ncbi:DeoR/GlpR family DNA-binding transcription regulator [Mucilaginibacter sp.]|jgi:DeoR family fructose operon transcriptional repressor|uniref:DeoR/GlpR family DNA-binding transcription regulator n=1 Tax=Mucilaginibacter sp. TaxID=1882438 RepID=UPI002BE4C202|nr:DeoR/GlpR family DNA-binding transcription regulator [Mucilaginibacter sp.]HTI58148.1 DeoR/GlpR family DNA-binding transcription regulator [Mucilaginibacter sp.]